MKFSLSKDKKSLVIELPIHEPRLTASGKSCVVSGTGGFAATGISAGDYPIKVSVNAIVDKAAAGSTIEPEAVST